MVQRLKKVIKARTKQSIRRDVRQFCFEVLERREVMTAGLEPVVLIPGFGGTFANESNTTVNEWLTTRGLAPNKLALEPFGGVYQNIVQSLKNVGYVDSGIGQNLFVVNWDWRVPAAPSDTNSAASPNGTLGDVTVAGITDTVYQTGLDYLGKTLADIKLLYPSATKVDVIAHSTGGVIARSYIQSAAYGQGGLPTIDDLVLAGVPNEGVADPFNLSGDDWSSKAAARAAAQMVDRAYELFVAGTPINGPSGAIPALPKNNEVQRLGWNSTLGATGTFTISFNGATTAALPANSTAGGVQTALQGLATVGNGNVQVELLAASNATQDRVFKVTFIGSRAGLDQPQATINIGGLATGSPSKIEATDREGGTNSLEAFAQLYVGSLANLLPTYDAVDTNNDGVFEKLSTTNPAGNSRVNVLMNDLNAGTKNAWLNSVGKTNVVYSTEGTTRDRLVARTGPSSSGFLTDEILSLQNFIGRRPAPGEVWYEDTASGHGGDGTVATFSSVDPFLNDSRIGSKLNLIPITGAAAGVTAVSHTELVVNPYSQTQILNAVGATNFTNANLVSNLTVSKAGAVAKALSTGLLRPADAISEAATRFNEVLATTKARDVLDTVVAYTSTKLGTLLPVDSLWQLRVITPLTALLTSNPNANLTQIVTALNSGLPGAFTLVADTANEKSISFNFTATSFAGGVTPTANGTFNLGSGYGSLGVNGNYTLTGNLAMSGVIGIDMNQGDDFGSGLFVRNLSLTMGATGAISSLNANVAIGTAPNQITAAIENGTFNLNASAAVGSSSHRPATFRSSKSWPPHSQIWSASRRPLQSI